MSEEITSKDVLLLTNDFVEYYEEMIGRDFSSYGYDNSLEQLKKSKSIFIHIRNTYESLMQEVKK